MRERSSWKVIHGRQEWITSVEGISAAGSAIPPLIIYKAKHTNTAWIPPDTPDDWYFSTSNSRWTSDSHGLRWLRNCFEPYTRSVDPDARRLLIADGHSSHVTASIIAYCMQHMINLLILPPHRSHILQPLDVGMFAPLKRALAVETDRASRLDPGRISRTEWTTMYIRAREKAFTTANIQSSWSATGLEPLKPLVVIEKLSSTRMERTSRRAVSATSSSLDLSLLTSSPPKGTELRQANALLSSALRGVEGLLSTARRYTERTTRAFEATQRELTTIRES